MATLEKKSPGATNKLPHQQSLPTPQVHQQHNQHHQLQQQLSQPMVQNNNNNNNSKNLSNGGESMQVSTEQQSDNSSLYSVELETLNDAEHRYIDSDPGFGSMSSSEQAQMCNLRQQQEAHHKEIDDLKQEITKLKCDKLDLLRQNVVSNGEKNCREFLSLIYRSTFHFLRHVSAILRGCGSTSCRCRATLRPRAWRSCDSVSSFKTSRRHRLQMWRRMARATPPPCCKRIIMFRNIFLILYFVEGWAAFKALTVLRHLQNYPNSSQPFWHFFLLNNLCFLQWEDLRKERKTILTNQGVIYYCDMEPKINVKMKIKRKYLIFVFLNMCLEGAHFYFYFLTNSWNLIIFQFCNRRMGGGEEERERERKGMEERILGNIPK
jgi:hypothetical protein